MRSEAHEDFFEAHEREFYDGYSSSVPRGERGHPDTPSASWNVSHIRPRAGLYVVTTNLVVGAPQEQDASSDARLLASHRWIWLTLTIVSLVWGILTGLALAVPDFFLRANGSSCRCWRHPGSRSDGLSAWTG